MFWKGSVRSRLQKLEDQVSDLLLTRDSLKEEVKELNRVAGRSQTKIPALERKMKEHRHDDMCDDLIRRIEDVRTRVNLVYHRLALGAEEFAKQLREEG